MLQLVRDFSIARPRAKLRRTRYCYTNFDCASLVTSVLCRNS